MTEQATSALLDVWEAGLALTPGARAALLLDSAGVPESRDWPVGLRDLTLLQLYCGGHALVSAVTACPTCGAELDVEIDVDRLPAAASADTVVTIDELGYRVVARLPTGRDLAALTPDLGPEEQLLALLDSCVLEATAADLPIDVGLLPAPVVEALDAAMDDADPGAAILLALKCAPCGAEWSEPFDPVRFAWSEVESSARRLATDVHTLAHAYGWSEQEILALSPFRRRLYLSAVAP